MAFLCGATELFEADFFIRLLNIGLALLILWPTTFQNWTKVEVVGDCYREVKNKCFGVSMASEEENIE